MRAFHALLSISLLAASAAACAAATPPPEAAPPPSDSALPAAPAPTASASTPPPAPSASACAGTVDSPPSGLEPLDEPAPSFSIGAPGKGALCEGKVFAVKQPVTVYRAFTAKFETTKKAGPTGAYWTFQKPTGNQDAYRTTYEICAEWNDLDMLNECQIDVGARVVLGPGQSADCDGGTRYPPSAANQVLIVRGSDGKVPVSGCKQSPMAWGK